MTTDSYKRGSSAGLRRSGDLALPAAACPEQRGAFLDAEQARLGPHPAVFQAPAAVGRHDLDAAAVHQEETGALLATWHRSGPLRADDRAVLPTRPPVRLLHEPL